MANRITPRVHDDALAFARRLLEALPEAERIAVASYYCGVEPAEQIESSMELPHGYLAQVRTKLRKRFFAHLARARRRRPKDPGEPQ